MIHCLQAKFVDTALALRHQPRLIQSQGFTLIELLIVIAIIGILGTVVLVAINPERRFQEIYFNRAKQQLGQLNEAVEVYRLHHNNQFPPDVDRNIPPGLEKYLKSADWPNGPWPKSIFDWDNIDLPNGDHYYQISIRFCDADGSSCRFPTFDWAKDFDQNSAVYYCIEGPCRPHRTVPADHPGYCINCKDPFDGRT